MAIQNNNYLVEGDPVTKPGTAVGFVNVGQSSNADPTVYRNADGQYIWNGEVQPDWTADTVNQLTSQSRGENNATWDQMSESYDNSFSDWMKKSLIAIAAAQGATSLGMFGAEAVPEALGVVGSEAGALPFTAEEMAAFKAATAAVPEISAGTLEGIAAAEAGAAAFVPEGLAATTEALATGIPEATGGLPFTEEEMAQFKADADAAVPDISPGTQAGITAAEAELLTTPAWVAPATEALLASENAWLAGVPGVTPSAWPTVAKLAPALASVLAKAAEDPITPTTPTTGGGYTPSASGSSPMGGGSSGGSGSGGQTVAQRLAEQLTTPQFMKLDAPASNRIAETPINGSFYDGSTIDKFNQAGATWNQQLAAQLRGK